MNRAEFTGLPLSLALGLLWDRSAGLREAMEKIPALQIPRAPKFDQPIYRKDGITWASEYALEGLLYWQGRYSDSANSGGEYAEKDAKRVKQLGFWIAWRRCEPNAVWSGKRNDEQVTASAPNDKPFVYERDRKPEGSPSSTGSGFQPSFEDSVADEEPPF